MIEILTSEEKKLQIWSVNIHLEQGSFFLRKVSDYARLIQGSAILYIMHKWKKKSTLNPRNSTKSGQRGLKIRGLEIGDLKMCRPCRAWLCIGQNKILGLRLLSVTLCGSKTISGMLVIKLSINWKFHCGFMIYVFF